MPFPYKNVLITGATSGIGRALTDRMIAAGIFVIAVGRREDRMKELVAKHGDEKIALEVFDVSRLDTIAEWSSRIIARYPKLDCIILNAGMQQGIDFSQPTSINPGDLTAEIATNYLGPVHMITHFLPHLMSVAKSGRVPAAVVLVSSSLALAPLPRCPNYCASKAALHSLAWTLRAQLTAARCGVRVVEVLPPAVQTELHQRQGLPEVGVPLRQYADQTWKELREEDKDEFLWGSMFDGLEDGKRQVFEGWLGTARQGKFV
ncbi:short chain dehydrogenase [Achaetomium macrosporum]|uniref:Short chain dehydrogenase n=1 Tax=Achaetomium macrosporum TaxID=79813 RepID=A0AAN7C7N2_9PEZI|nr:short chain dehydrogenase [Achaetomium macrosporum]